MIQFVFESFVLCLQVIAAYLEHGLNHKAASQDECSAMFTKKLNGYKKAKLSKDRVFYKK